MPGRKQPEKAVYDNTDHFALFPNENMRDDKNDPDLSGFINIDGKEYWFKGWVYWDKKDNIRLVSGHIGEERQAQQKPNAKPEAEPETPSKRRRR